MADTRSKTAIIGAGTIGRGFAVLFASAGHRVSLFDPEAPARDAALALIATVLDDLGRSELLEEAPDQVLARIEVQSALSDAVCDADFVQECIPERAELKRKIFADLDRLGSADAIFASASSSMPASTFAGETESGPRCLVAHPGNPPFLLRIIEIVPAPFTAPATVARTADLFEAMGVRAIIVRKEIDGFVFNRLQGAVLREAYCLVRDGVAEVEDIDAVMCEGLGLRWAVLGPFETVDLNTVGGIAEHARRLGPAYARMGAQRGQDDPWTPELVAHVARARRASMPEEARATNIRRRDRVLMALLSAKRKMNTR